MIKKLLLMLVAMLAFSMAQAQTESEIFNTIIEGTSELNEFFNASMQQDPKLYGKVNCEFSYDEANKCLILTYSTSDKEVFGRMLLKRKTFTEGTFRALCEIVKLLEYSVSDFLNDYQKYDLKCKMRLAYFKTSIIGKQFEHEIDAKEARKLAKKFGY